MNAVARIVAGRSFAAALLLTAMTALTPSASAQASTSQPQAGDLKNAPESIEIFHLAGSTQPNTAGELLTSLRNVLSRARTYYDSAQSAIVVRGTAEEIEQVRKIVAELDKPLATYRVTYSITQIEDGKRAGTAHYTVIAVAGQRTDLRQGTRVPIVTGKPDGDSSTGPSVLVQYVDVGLNITATVNGSSLSTKIEQSAVADEKSNVGIQDPVLRQTVLEGMATVTAGKPLVLGSLDIPGSTRHEEVEVLVERMM